MPAKSAKQFGMMEAIMHGSKMKGFGGPSKKVAKEFVDKTPEGDKHKFAKALAKKRH